MPHEIVSAFQQRGFPLCETLAEMLDDHFTHRTERRGCGFTQASRFLAVRVNRPRERIDASDLDVFKDWPERPTRELAQAAIQAGWSLGWRNLHQADADTVDALKGHPLLHRLQALPAVIDSVQEGLQHIESRTLAHLIADLLVVNGNEAGGVTGLLAKPEIGSCSQAEEFFLEIAHERVRRGGLVNTIVDGRNRPVMLEKLHLGESHSAIVIAPLRVFDVGLPPGSLCALRYDESAIANCPLTRHGRAIPVDSVGVLFMRLTTLAVPPEARRRAFTCQVDAQLRADMFSPLTTSLADLEHFARRELSTNP